jgi:hypothetical protein
MEAVELYEAAGEEYKAVYGDHHSHDERLHSTDMPRGALEHIAKDFEVRGLEVFQEVQQILSRSSANGMLCLSAFFYSFGIIMIPLIICAQPQAADAADEDMATANFNAALLASDDRTN